MNVTTNSNSEKYLQDIIEQIYRYAQDVWRYRWRALTIVWLIAVLGWFIVIILPYKYEASAKIYADTDSMLRPLLKGLAVESDLDERLRLMTRTLLSIPNIENVLRTTDMDIETKDTREMELLVKEMRKSIQITATGKHNLYTITYSDKSPKRAKAVVQALLNALVDSALGETRIDSERARKFLDNQIHEYESKLVEAEQKLMKFKRKHMGVLPSQGSDYFQRLEDSRADLENAKGELSQSQQRRKELQRQLDVLKNSASSSESSSFTTSIDKRIQAMESQLDELLLKYTDEHPAVQELKTSIAALKEQKKKEIQAISQESPKALLGENTFYQELSLALGKAYADEAAAKVKVNDYERKVVKLQELVDTLPKIEAELSSLNRDYDLNKQQYDTLLARRESAKMSEQVESAGDNVKFQIIDPPHVPITPTSPNKIILNTAVLIGSLTVGIGIVLLIAQFYPVFYDRKSLINEIGYPVYGSISLILDQKVKKRKMFLTSLYVACSLALIVTYGVITVIQIRELV